MGLYEKAVARIEAKEKREIATLNDYAQYVGSTYANGLFYGQNFQQTLGGERAEYIGAEFVAFAQQAYASNGPIFALMAVRQMAFSGIRFQWQRINGGKPGNLFGNPDLGILERPWPGANTQDLLVRMINHADLGGNSYTVRISDEAVPLRPDWMSIVLAPRMYGSTVLGYKRVGYVYEEGGLGSGQGMSILPLKEVSHFAPHPDPLATYRGMSWLTPVIREMQSDKLMQTHQRKFFENGATPNMVISMSDTVSFEDFKKFKAELALGHEGVHHAYKTMVIGGGADATVVGSNFEQMSFTSTQGRGETRLAAAAGVPVTIVGFSEGLQGSSLNAGNFAQARRRLADITMSYLWASAVGSLQTIVPTPGGSSGSVRLWYDERDVPFLREDAKDVAQIMQMNAATLNSLVNSGWTPESAKAFVDSYGDFNALQHTGLLSVQLQPPGTVAEPPSTETPTEE